MILAEFDLTYIEQLILILQIRTLCIYEPRTGLQQIGDSPPPLIKKMPVNCYLL